MKTQGTADSKAPREDQGGGQETWEQTWEELTHSQMSARRGE